MSTILYWFSGTGNSLAAARELAKRLGGDVRLSPLARAIEGELQPADRVGVVFPVYACGPPRIVVEFFRTAPIPADSYLFAVATNGGMPGRPFHFIRQTLRPRGLSLAAGWAPSMPGNCITLCGAQPADKQRKIFDSFTGKIERIAQAVNRQDRGRYEDSRPPLSWLLGLVWRMGMPHMAEADRKFLATEACTRCGLCEKICPVENIRLADGRPEWLHHCEQCMACIQWCPPEAIQSGKRTAGRARYHHPAVTAADLCLREPAPAS